jgi:hypothetical protein
MSTKCVGRVNVSLCVAVLTVKLAIGEVGRQVHHFYFSISHLHSTELSVELCCVRFTMTVTNLFNEVYDTISQLFVHLLVIIAQAAMVNGSWNESIVGQMLPTSLVEMKECTKGVAANRYIVTGFLVVSQSQLVTKI